MNIALVGMMGSGKSTVGRMVAGKLGMRFADTDALVEEMAEHTIAEIFDESGEAEFRKLEKIAVRNACGIKDAVVSVGGGALQDKKNVDVLWKNCIVFHLKSNPEMLAKRLENDASRPLLSNGSKLARLRSLLKRRQPAYALADFTIDASTGAEACAAAVVSAMKFRSEIVAVISAKKVGQAVKQLAAAAKEGAEWAELRLDLLGRPTEADATILARKCKSLGLNCIATVRGKLARTQNGAGLLSAALSAGADLADADLRDIRSLNSGINRSRLLVSFHDFNGTPAAKKLRQLVAKMRKVSRNIKIVCKVRSTTDERNLLQLLEGNADGKTTVFGIGEKGRRSRVLAAFKGSRFFYSFLGKPVAEGQFSLMEAMELKEEWQ